MLDVMTTAISGLNKATEKLADATTRIVNATSTKPENEKTSTAMPEDQISLSPEAILDVKESAIAYKANAAVIATELERSETLMNMLKDSEA